MTKENVSGAHWPTSWLKIERRRDDVSGLVGRHQGLKIDNDNVILSPGVLLF